MSFIKSFIKTNLIVIFKPKLGDVNRFGGNYFIIFSTRKGGFLLFFTRSGNFFHKQR